MVNSALRNDGTLPEWLSSHACAVSARRLVFDLVGGLLLVSLALLWRPAAWPALMGAGLCFAAFGIWAFAERHLAVSASDLPSASAPDRCVAWRALRGVSACVGMAALVLMSFALLFSTLGTWIS